MMQKLISNKKIVICGCAAVAVAVVALAALLFHKEETFRSILVYDVEGNAVIERENVGDMDAVENLYLESGDRVSVAADSSMRMKLDDDKYVMAEADTIFSVEAEGTETDSRTKISLEQGAITNEIQHPLSDGSSYETSTPNSVMAVRGTIYRAELYADENGGQNTKLCCFQGKVGAKPILSDGTYGEEILVPAGSELTIYQDGTVGEVRDIAYGELPRQAIENLLDLVESGQDVTGISAEELADLTLKTEKAGEAAESENGQPEQPEAEQAEQPETEETVLESDTDEGPDTQADAAKSASAKAGGKAQNRQTPQPAAGQPAPQPQDPAPQPPKTAAPVSSGNIDNGNTGEEGSQDENAGNDSDEDKSDKDKKDKDKPSKPKTYTVTFMYQGSVFATQSVKSGETAAAPVLVPDVNGAWDFDFGTKIKANTTITWK